MSHVQDPPRWLETDELPSELRSELSAYASEAPNVERRARMLEHLEQQLGFGGVPATELPGSVAQPALGGASGAGTGAAAGTLVKFKLVLSVLATAGAVLGAWALWSAVQSPSRTASLVHGDAVSSSAPFRALHPGVTRWASAELEPSPAEPAQGAPTLGAREPVLDVETPLAPAPLARRERKSRASVRPSTQPSAQPSTQAETSGADDLLSDEPAAGAAREPLSELTLLARARRSLLTSPERSLELAEQHARDFPTGTLCEEREVLAIESLLKLGRVALAKQRALLFERSFPSSAHRAHLARLIARPVR